MDKFELLARQAISQLRRKGLNLPLDAVDEAKLYAQQGFNMLSSLSSYDPQQYATPMADEAVVEYVKGRMIGETSQTFYSLAQLWTKEAADAYYKSN